MERKDANEPEEPLYLHARHRFHQVPYVILEQTISPSRINAQLSPTVATNKPCHLCLPRLHWCSVRFLRAPDRSGRYVNTHPWGPWKTGYMGRAWWSRLLSHSVTSLSLPRPLHASLIPLHGFPKPTLRHLHLHLMQQNCFLPPSKISRVQLSNSTSPAILSLRLSSKIWTLWPHCLLVLQNYILFPRPMPLLPR